MVEPWAGDDVAALVDAHLETLAGDHLVRIPAARGAEIVAAVRAAGRHRLVTPGIDLARTTWAVVAPSADRQWWRALADAGEDIAITGRDPEGLIELLHRSGTAFARAGDRTAADDQWRRAFALTQRLGDHDRSARLLHLVGDLRRAGGSLGRALTAFFELVRVRAEQDDRVGLAAALTEVGVTMARTGRLTDADYFLGRARKALPRATGLPPSALVRHAATLVALGRAWDGRGAHAAAMPCYSQALAELVDVDDYAAEEVRVLLAAAAARRRG